MIVIAIDPGFDRCGYAVFKFENKPSLLDYGCISSQSKLSISQRIYFVTGKIEKIIRRYKPQTLIIESIFFSKNKKTVVAVAQTQGALMLTAARLKLSVEFLNPTTVKSTIVGYGNADKKQIKKMLALEYGLKLPGQLDDTIDAIAVGLTFYHLQKSYDWKNLR